MTKDARTAEIEEQAKAMAPVAPKTRHVVNIHDDAFLPMPRSDGGFGGESALQVGRPRTPGTGFHVYRMAPGTWTEPHRHHGEEHFFVIEGSLIDHDGVEYGPGDLVCLDDGTEHCSYSENGALLVVLFNEPPK